MYTNTKSHTIFYEYIRPYEFYKQLSFIKKSNFFDFQVEFLNWTYKLQVQRMKKEIPPQSRKSKMIMVYAALQQVESKIQKLNSLLFVIQFYELFMLMYLIIRTDIVNPKLNSSGLMNPGFTNIDSYLYYSNVFEMGLIMYSIITVFFFMLIFLSQIKNKYFQKDFLVWFSSIIVILSRIAYLYSIHQVINVFLYEDSSYPLLGSLRYLLLVPIFLFIIYNACVNRNSYIYGMLHPLIIILPIIDSTDYVLFVFLIAIFVYKNIYQPNSKNIIFVNTLMVPLFYKLCQSFKTKIQGTELIFMLFFIVIIIVHLFWKPLRITVLSGKKNDSKKYQLFNKKKLLDEYYQYVKGKKQTAMKIQEEMLIQSIIVDQFDKCHQNSVQRLKKFIEGKKVSQWTLQNHIQFLLSEAELYYLEEKGKQSHYLLLLYRLQDVKLYYNSLLNISNQFYKQSVFTIHKYRLYKLMVKMQDWFKKFKNEALQMEEALEADKMLLRFNNNLDSLFSLFIQIWSAIKKQVIDFSIIEPIYIKAIKKYKQLEKTLVLLKKRVRVTNQIYKFNRVSNLLQLKVLSTEDAKLSHFDDQKQDPIPFLKVCNQKIIYSSHKFNSRYSYTNEQILGMDAGQILPQYFRQKFFSQDQEQQDGVHLKLKEFTSVIINGKRCLQYVKIIPYIQKDFFGAITFIVFFIPQNTCSSSYMLYSLDTDVIEELSNGFLQLFGLQCKDSHNTVTGKQAFQQYDFASQKHRQQLATQGSMVQTNISISQFRSTIADRFHKITVSLRLIHLFDFKGSIRLLLEVKPITSEYLKSLAPGLGMFVDGITPNNTFNNMTSNQKLQSKPSIQKDQSSQNMRFMADLVQKKQVFNRDKSRDNFVKNNWKSILRSTIFITSIIVISVFMFYGSSWYTYMQKQISRLNEKLLYIISTFQNQFLIMIFKNWPSSYLTTQQNNKQLQKHFGFLSYQTNALYLQIINTLDGLELPLVKFYGGMNIGEKITGSNINSFNIISSSYLLYSQNIVQFSLDSFKIMPLLFTAASQIDSNFQIFKTWMNTSIIIAGLTLTLLVAFRIYETYKDKMYEKILEDIEMLFSYLKDQEIDACIIAIQKTSEEFNMLENVTKSHKKYKTQNLIETQLKTLKMIQDQAFLQKKTSKSSGSNLRLIVKSALYIIVMTAFFVYLITYVVQVRKQMPDIIKYENEIQLACRKTQVNIVNSYYQMIQQKLGDDPKIKLNNLFATSLINYDYLIPMQFKKFYGQIWNIINDDVCDLADPIDLPRCKQSILSKGLINTININFINIQNMMKRGLDDLFSDNLYNEIIFLRKYLLKKMRSILSLYDLEMSNYLKNRIDMYFVIISFSIMITILSIILIWIDYKDEINRTSICKSLFNIFPESFFLKPDIMNYVEEVKLTQRLLKF